MSIDSQVRRRTGLAEKRAALGLAAVLIGIPLLPNLVSAFLPPMQWETVEGGAPQDHVDIYTADGSGVSVEAPDGWQAEDHGVAVALSNGDARAFVRVFDLDGRDPQDMQQRVMRKDRVDIGFHEALDGGHITSGDGVFTGDTCVAVTADEVGTCAFLTDGDVLIAVLSLGSPDARDQIVAELTRSEQ
ncbi:hypothetical protein JRC04_17115 [Mycolicibacterium sp. S2-37]|uniref:hypothetical protein n=1 Tax=Mycolicibacterium sp. S2-37 TaxID=2810297 RepID=UPI001A94121C|nr:hypothetical protein [Mycolicibacterium sp. S2-37]MBO0679187.1 hypothetical protein [Mycolicibacterium sp. S2-37]